ncbi:ABC transporter substrate-binding protein [Venenivibrio stagnispumantis]|uniref:1,4-dihydroxy-6-naphtoate synthase n=1 Tax=Venenivibrio stagnispumantis TaxID=407998 RepID=A0AA45WMW5_9AQUI|nr:MqnA/MqnD/SBP family protein [Venenivibrio stagnispumantis]MCW4573722.1 ABC transporter substrate-binding protein [Venenivibrio stagnispumantis]SMP15935.1 1,4-dihydroxy-6-naphthoate synthase [Venenivibrio stagnispumantis]
MKIHIAHSPDSDDAFMFYAINTKKIDTKGYEFIDVLSDIETLNKEALKGRYEVSAISIHAFPLVADKYALLSSGASMGDNYGPIVVSKEDIKPEDLINKKIAVPGLLTSAFLALSLFLGTKDFNYEVMPFDKIIDAVKEGKVDAGLIIHEGQLTYKDEGLKEVIDLGKWWYEKTDGLPLPLGGNVIRKDLGEKVMKEISEILKESIKYSLTHREEAVDYALKFARGMNKEKADKFIGMYVNDLTVDYGERGKKAIEIFLKEAYEKGLIENLPKIEFV